MPRDRITSSMRRQLRRENELVDVRLAWYSIEDWDKTYHVCTECPRYWKILRSNLRITTVTRLPKGFEMCSTCASLPRRDCAPVYLKVSKG